ncbi:MAG: hypothetical protein KatS3mg054_0120 [Chloroflexus sp.]|nr:MAG: hypothetical protein KatS3mg054_0120 [Chloroflexus sp.]
MLKSIIGMVSLGKRRMVLALLFSWLVQLSLGDKAIAWEIIFQGNSPGTLLTLITWNDDDGTVSPRRRFPAAKGDTVFGYSPWILLRPTTLNEADYIPRNTVKLISLYSYNTVGSGYACFDWTAEIIGPNSSFTSSLTSTPVYVSYTGANIVKNVANAPITASGFSSAVTSVGSKFVRHIFKALSSCSAICTGAGTPISCCTGAGSGCAAPLISEVRILGAQISHAD